MAYVKKLVMNGFKSFANKTEIPFDRGINVIIGPNGSGKSNITDALCFVLGRLSSKSMRASKASHLLFHGNKHKKHANEASVEIIFDNSDKSFKIESKEVRILRAVRRKGSSIYKINGETKTRQEILELLAQAGIDPHGFNLVLQGEIAHLIKMRSEERRQILEEVSGISIYESRKQKSLKEIEKTEQKLKEVSAVLRERTAYLKNLEEERKQALKYQDLQKSIKQCKATIIKRNLDEKEKKITEIRKEIEKNTGFKEKLRDEIQKVNSEIEQLDKKSNEINQYIQKTTGFERDSLNDEVTELNVKIASERARYENFEKRLAENELRKKGLRDSIKEIEDELENLRKESPKVSKRQSLLKEKKAELEKIESERELIYDAKTELSTLKERTAEKKRSLDRINSDNKNLINQINSITEKISSKTIKEAELKIEKLTNLIKEINEKIELLNKEKIEIGNNLSVIDSDIKRNERIRENIPKKDICPICQTKLTENHRKIVMEGSNNKINSLSSEKEKNKKLLDEMNSNYEELRKKTISDSEILDSLKSELNLLESINEKKNLMRVLVEDDKKIKEEINKLNERYNKISSKLANKDSIEEKYNKLFFEMQELSARTDENLDASILYKERDIENTKAVLKSIDKDEVELKNEIKSISEQTEKDEKLLNEKEEALEELSEKFQKMFEERTKIQETVKDKNLLIVNKQNALGRIDEIINTLKLDNAKISAEHESLEYEIKEFQGIEFIQGSINFLQERLKKAEQTLASIGNVNLRALETYDTIKKEYEEVYKKVEQLEKERDEIIQIITEIDTKKKRTFMKTFRAINELFTRNFSQLSTKGKAFLEIENPENIFEGGINISIKVANGKYLDIASLSGGEKTLVALSLIFAIQEFNPYAFYILDEIDAALDKRNSELLANLLKKYIKSGQYIIISHNDSIISGADVLYGISMNDGISKILSLELKESK